MEAEVWKKEKCCENVKRAKAGVSMVFLIPLKLPLISMLISIFCQKSRTSFGFPIVA